MARCGCNTECNCPIVPGDCTTVTGSGSPADPYVIGVVVDNETIFCTPDGLEARLNHIDTNTVDLEGQGTVADPLTANVILTPDANVPDPDALGTGNLIQLGPTGIYVSCEDVQDCVGAAITGIAVSDCLEYDDATNTINVLICGEQNGVECVAPGGEPNCPDGGLLVTPSSDPGNGLAFGTDNRLIFQAPAIQPGDCMIITGTGTPADPFVISPQVAPELNGLECVPGSGLLVTPSSDADNNLIFGSDNRLYVDNCPFLIGTSQLLIGNGGPCFELIGDACNTPLQATLRLSDDVCQGLECRADGLYVEVDDTPVPTRVSNFAQTAPFPGLGPFNGTNPGLVLDGPTCITISNPSPCRDLVTSGDLTGFLDVGRQNGEILAHFEVATNPGGPFIIVGSNGQAEPTPPSRNTTNVAWQGLEVTIPPGGSRDVCVRTTISFTNVQTGRLFFSERTLTLTGRWARS